MRLSRSQKRLLVNLAKLLPAFNCLKGASRRFETGERSEEPLSSEDDAYFRLIRDRLKKEKLSPAKLRAILLGGKT